jgi:hypothetical protein
MPRRKLSKEEIQKRIDNAASILREIASSRLIPRNIRRTAEDAINALYDEKYSPAVRAANAIGTIENVLYDPNMPSFARVKIWNAVSILETIRD